MNAASFGCCIFRISPLLDHEPKLSWNPQPPNPNRSLYPLTLRKHSNHQNSSSILVTGALQQGLGVVPHESVASNPLIGTEEVVEKEENKDVHGPLNGVADTKPPSPFPKVQKKKEHDYQDDSFENRYKLRNGREVRFL